jgi:hypothetical protein
LAVALAQVIDDLLLQYRVEDPTDTERSLGMLLQLSRALTANADESARIYRMRAAFPDAKRSLDQHGKISSIRRLLQGPTRSGGGYSYPGDFEFRDPDRVTVQLHLINLTEIRAANENVVLQSVPVVAVWIPNRMGLGWIVQDQASRT